MDLYDLEKTALLSGGLKFVSGVVKPVFKTVSKAFGGGKAAARTVESVVPQSQSGRILAMKPGVYAPNKAAVTATQGPVTRHSTTIGGSQIRATPVPKRVPPAHPATPSSVAATPAAPRQAVTPSSVAATPAAPRQAVTPSSVAATPAAPRQAPLQITHNPGSTRQPIENTGVHSYTHKPSANSWGQANGGARAATKTVDTPQVVHVTPAPGAAQGGAAAAHVTPSQAPHQAPSQAPHQAPARDSGSVWQHQELPGEVAAKKSWIPRMPSKAGMAAIGGSLVVGGVLGHAVASPKSEYQEPQ